MIDIKNNMLMNVIYDFCKKNPYESDGNYRKGRPYNITEFINECDFNTSKTFYRIINGQSTLTSYYAEKIAFRLNIPVYMVYIYLQNNVIKIVHLDDIKKPKRSVACKICWNEKDKNHPYWEKQIVLYNELYVPPAFSHPVWSVICQWDMPEHEKVGEHEWYNFKYFLFNECENNEEEYVNKIVGGEFEQVIILNLPKENGNGEKIIEKSEALGIKKEELINKIISDYFDSF